MEQLHCEACGSSWLAPTSMDAAVRREIASLFRQADSIRAIRLLREQTGLSLGDSKGVYYHISKQLGECHRCGATLAGGSTVVCGLCKSINLNW